MDPQTRDATTPMPDIYSLLGQTLALIEKESTPERLHLLGLLYKLKLSITWGSSRA